MHQAFINSDKPILPAADSLDGVDSDILLWDEFRGGSLKAFDLIYYKFVKLLYNYGRKISNDAAVIEDSIQDLFVELWQKKHLLSPTDSIKFYLFRALNQKIIRRLKNENKLNEKYSLSEEYDFEVVFSHEFHLISEQISMEEKESLAKALETLTPRQKEAIFLKYFEKLSFEEVSSILAINIKGTYKLVARAIEVLRNEMVKKHYLIPLPLFAIFL